MTSATPAPPRSSAPCTPTRGHALSGRQLIAAVPHYRRQHHWRRWLWGAGLRHGHALLSAPSGPQREPHRGRRLDCPSSSHAVHSLAARSLTCRHQSNPASTLTEPKSNFQRRRRSPGRPAPGAWRALPCCLLLVACCLLAGVGGAQDEAAVQESVLSTLDLASIYISQSGFSAVAAACQACARPAVPCHVVLGRAIGC